MNYARVSNPEDYAGAQSRNPDGAGARLRRWCGPSGPWGVDVFASWIAGCWGGVGACFGGWGECCGGVVG